MTEFDRYMQYSGVMVRAQEPFRLYTAGRKTWRLLWLRGTPASAVVPGRGDTVLAETALSEETITGFRNQGVYWLDLGARTRSREGSRLTEELVLFLGRYGIRLKRD